MREWKQYVATGALGLALVASGCAARTGPIRGDASVEGDRNTARSGGEVHDGRSLELRGQANTESETGRKNKNDNTARQGNESTTRSGSLSSSGSGSFSGSGSGSGSLSGSGTMTESGS
jgi:hypothetical protein